MKLNVEHWMFYNNIIKYAGNNTDLEVEITTIDYPPGDYFVTFNLTDIYGQTFQARAPLLLRRMFILFDQVALLIFIIAALKKPSIS